MTIGFSVGIGAFMIALIVMSCQSRSKAKRDKAEREALLGNPRMRSTSDVEAFKMGRGNARMGASQGLDDHVPLITPSGSHQPQAEYFDQGRGAAPNVPPKFNQGLGALGQEPGPPGNSGAFPSRV